MKQVNILNVPVDSFSMEELLKRLKHGGVVFTPNVDHIMKLRKDRDFYHIYQSADYRVCDSQIIMLASQFLGQPIQEKISGSDLFPAFCDYYRYDKQIKIFLLGGFGKIAEQARERINARIGREIVIDTYSPPFGFETDKAECQKIVELINNSGATVLAVGLGAPKQEKWIYHYQNKLNQIKIFFAIGATIEFEAGHRPRAPKWMSFVGLEWLFRLSLEPKRLGKRYLVDDFPFLFLVLKQKLSLYFSKKTQPDYQEENSVELESRTTKLAAK